MSGRVSSAPRGSERLPAGRQGLVARRRNRRRRASIALGVIFLLLCAGIVYGLRQPMVRISDIQVLDANQSFAEIARSALEGSYLGIIPHDSIFFFPASRIRAAIMEGHPDIAAVSIFRQSFSGISIKVNNRVPIARWCGVAPDGADCYFFDASGVVYTPTSIVRPVNSFTVYQSLTMPEGSQASGTPIGGTLRDAEQFPSVFDFARQLSVFGLPVSFIMFRNDEVDVYFESGARITYLLGDEQNAFTALVSAKAQLNLADPSLEYVDVRFPGKVYLKKKE